MTPAAQQRRAQILDAFQRVLGEHGYDGATIGRIAREAGLSSGLLHYHFDNKLRILVALAERMTRTAEARVASRDARARSPRELVDALLDGLLALDDDASPATAAAWAALAAEAARRPEVGEVHEAWLRRLRGALRARLRRVCAAEGRQPDRVDELALTLVATVQGLLGLAAAAPGEIPAGRAAPLARRVAHDLLDALPEAS